MTEDKVPTGGVAALMRDRARLYRLLARVWLREVDEDFLAALRAMRYPQGSDDLATDEAWRRVYSFVRRAREDALDVLAVDYARTILGSGTLTDDAAFPYESVYTSDRGLTMQEARDEVLAVYRANGVDRDPAWTDPEDHLALELSFVATLAERCAEALDVGDDDRATSLFRTQLGFAHAHLANWAPRFCTDVGRFCSTEFYGGFAQLTDRVLAGDLELLDDIARTSGISEDPADEAAGEGRGTDV